MLANKNENLFKKNKNNSQNIFETKKRNNSMDIESLKDQNKNSPPMTRKRTKMLTEKKANKK